MESSINEDERLHLIKLQDLVNTNSPLRDIFMYGIKFLPQITSPDGKKNLDALTGYSPDIRLYFDVLSDIESLPADIKDLATDLALYANGSSVELDNEIYSMNPTKRVEETFGNVK